MVLCSSCGCEAPEGSRFCPSCAAPLGSDQGPVTQTTVPTAAARRSAAASSAQGLMTSSDSFDEARFLADCLRLGKQLLLQRHIHSAVSVSKVLFQTALRLADNRRLLEPGPADLAARRAAFAQEVREVLRPVHAIDAIAASRRAGFIR